MEKLLAALGATLIALAFPGAKPLPSTHPLMRDVDAAAFAIAAEVPIVYPTLSPIEQERRARVSFVWGWGEAALKADPKGFNDAGAACGFGQVHVASMPPGVLPASMTCAAIRADLRTGVRAQLLVLRYLEGKCGGSLRDALTAYATGQCPTKGWTIPLVAKRCQQAGLTAGCATLVP